MSDNLLADVPLFSSLAPEDLESLSAKAVLRKYRKNTVIISEGAECGSLYVVKSGSLKVYVSDDDTREAILNELGAGDYFGELALLDSSPRSASVSCAEDCELMVISSQSFRTFLGEHRELAWYMLGSLAERVRVLTESVKGLALLDVYGRVAKLLADQARDEDGRQITGKLTQQDIANRVGSSREMISRILKDLREGGYIDIENKRIILNRKLPDRW